MNNIDFSIIIPLYNKERTIINTIQSVLQQNYDSIEVVIVDDGSTDNSCNLVQTIKDERVKLYRKANGGPSSARNYGILQAKGKWILFLDADDTLLEDSLSNINLILTQNCSIEILACNFCVKTDKARVKQYGNIKEGYVKDCYKEYVLGRLSLRTGAALFKTDVLKRVRFDERYHRYEDLEFILNIFDSYKVYRTNLTILEYDTTEIAASKPCNNPQEDYITHLTMTKKPLYRGLMVYCLYRECVALYPDTVCQVYNRTEFDLIRFRVMFFILRIYRRLKRIINQS